MKKNVIVISSLILLVTGVAVASIYGYERYQDHLATQNAQAAIVKAQEAIATKKAENLSVAKYDADISRLVSICMDSQARYDALTPALKVKEIRPDCTISQSE